MKNLIYSAVILILLVSCDDDDEIQGDFVAAKLNGASWRGTPEINHNPANDTLTFLGVGKEQVVVFKIRFDGTGEYNLTQRQAGYYTTVGGDVITSEYVLAGDKPSKVIITQYDSEENTLEGNFNISLVKEWSNPEGAAETLVFTDGKFRGVVTSLP